VLGTPATCSVLWEEVFERRGVWGSEGGCAARCAVLCCAVLRVLGVGSTSCAGGAAVSVVGVVSEWGFGRTGGRVEDCGGRGEMVFWYSL
jgi:hypothetical protein